MPDVSKSYVGSRSVIVADFTNRALLALNTKVDLNPTNEALSAREGGSVKGQLLCLLMLTKSLC